MPNPLEDGEKHINISYQSKTQLGRMLAPPYEAGFNIPGNGSFSSVAGYWCWLVFDSEEGFRDVSGEQALVRGQFENAKSKLQSQNFQEKILKATWLKIRQNHNIFWRFEQNIKPFKRYYVYEDRLYKPSDAEWICDGLDVMSNYMEKNFW